MRITTTVDSDTGDPPLYDVARALSDLDRYRATADRDSVAAKLFTVAADLIDGALIDGVS